MRGGTWVLRTFSSSGFRYLAGTPSYLSRRFSQTPKVPPTSDTSPTSPISSLTMVKAKRWTIPKKWEGTPTEKDFKLEEQTLPALKDGEILCEAQFLSVDPYIRVLAPMLNPGDDIMCQQVAKIIESKSDKWPEGELVVGHFGWRTHTIVNAAEAEGDVQLAVGPKLQPIPDSLGQLSPTYALGVLGMPGATAYFGTIEVLGLKPGETLFVNAAAGAVGSIVGQVSRILGCTVVGCAGSEDKCQWLKTLGFDHVFNYKTRDLDEALKEAAPEGLDCYFENVGGHMGAKVVASHMKQGGRMAICGTIASYNDSKPVQGPYPWAHINMRTLVVRGFMGFRYYSEYPRAFRALAKWINQGQLNVREHVTSGFDKMPAAFLELFTGTNVGKAVVKV